VGKGKRGGEERKWEWVRTGSKRWGKDEGIEEEGWD